MNTVVHPFGNLPVVQSSGGVEFNWFCSVKDGVHQNAFDNHRICEGSIICQWILVAMFTTGIILVFFEWLESNVRATVLSVSSSIPVFCIILYAFGMSQQRRGRQMPFNISIRYVGNIIIFTRAVTMGARVINLARNGPCDDNATRYNMDCNPQHDQQLLPILPVLQLYATSLIVPIIYRCHTAWINFLCVFIVFGVMCVALTYANASEVMFHASGSLMIASLVGMYDFEHSVAHAFTAYSNLEKVTREKVIAENEKQIIEDNAKDLRHFIGNVAHDLKTPLQAFVSELDYLDESLGNDSRAGLHSVRSLKSTCHYMTMTINRSLDFVKSTSGFKLEPKSETINIDQSFEWVRNCIKQYARSNMHFILQKSESVCNHVITDKQWLWENLLCLASNSVKYIGDGGEIVFRVALETSSNCLSSSGPSKTPSLLFEVEDDGVGIPDKEMTALFQPFKQAQRNAGGTGLGLFALANRALAIGGHYGVRRRRDDRAGVLFWFTIPYRPDHTIALEEELHSNDVEIFKEDYPSKSISIDSVRESISISGESEQKASKDIGVRILLVEDSFMIQKATTRMLRNIGHSADIANNGMECLQRLSEKRYDLILMDINMPVMDGLQTIQRIRADESASSIDSQISGKFKKQLVIGVSADSDTSTRETALNAGMDDFLEKPLDIATLKKKCISHSISL